MPKTGTRAYNPLPARAYPRFRRAGRTPAPPHAQTSQTRIRGRNGAKRKRWNMAVPTYDPKPTPGEGAPRSRKRPPTSLPGRTIQTPVQRNHRSHTTGAYHPRQPPAHGRTPSKRNGTRHFPPHDSPIRHHTRNHKTPHSHSPAPPTTSLRREAPTSRQREEGRRQQKNPRARRGFLKSADTPAQKKGGRRSVVACHPLRFDDTCDF